MKYLKSFNESLNTNSWLDEEFSSPEEIAKIIDAYFREHEFTNLMTSMQELLETCHPHRDELEYSDIFRYGDILLSVTNLIENSGEPWWSVKFERF